MSIRDKFILFKIENSVISVVSKILSLLLINTIIYCYCPNFSKITTTKELQVAILSERGCLIDDSTRKWEVRGQ